jgi:hypothetical protein
MTAAPLPAERRLRPPAKRRVNLFLKHLAAGWSVTAAANEAGVDRRRFYEFRADDEAFAAAWDEAWERGSDVLVDELHRRALGYDEETWDGEGNLVRRVRRYSDPSLIAALKARRPEEYRDNMRVEHSGPGGGAIVTEHREKLTLEAALVQVKERREVAARPPLELPAGGAAGKAQ